MITLSLVFVKHSMRSPIFARFSDVNSVVNYCSVWGLGDMEMGSIRVEKKQSLLLIASLFNHVNHGGEVQLACEIGPTRG